MLTNCKHNFHTAALTTGFSDFYKMTLTTLKTEYVKADPIQIYYRNYKNFSSTLFKTDLRSNLIENELSNRNFDTFQNTLYDILNKHAPLKKKYVRANNSPFMTKQLRKMIMNRSRSRNLYLKNKTVENWDKHRKLRNECFKLTTKVKTEYYRNINIQSVMDNRKF